MLKSMIMLGLMLSAQSFGYDVRLRNGESIVVGDANISCGSGGGSTGRSVVSKHCTCEHQCADNRDGIQLCLRQEYSDGQRTQTTLKDYGIAGWTECERALLRHPSCR